MNNPFAVAQKYLGTQSEQAQPEPVWIARSIPPGDKDPQPEPGPVVPELERPTGEEMTARVLAEFQVEEAAEIVVAWRDLLGINLDEGKVGEQLRALRKWQERWRRNG